jgi:hypothetical protein
MVQACEAVSAVRRAVREGDETTCGDHVSDEENGYPDQQWPGMADVPGRRCFRPFTGRCREVSLEGPVPEA